MVAESAQPPASAAAQLLLDELVGQGVTDFVLAPGSRSAPLAWALAAAAEQGRIDLTVRVDERSAAFVALGMVKARVAIAQSARLTPPVAVVTTSGTAVANLYPAVLEAHHSGLPLLLLTADRPAQLRGTGASQTTDQGGIFGGAVRLTVDVPAPDGRNDEAQYLRSIAARVVAAAGGTRGGQPGPVHLNLAYREPLAPSLTTETVASWSVEQRGFLPRVRRNHQDQPWRPPIEVVRPTLLPGGDVYLPGNPAHTVVIAGDGAGPEAGWLAAAQGWPLLAEPSSGVADYAMCIPGYRLLLEEAASLGLDDVEQTVVFGHPTLSRAVQRLLADPQVAVTIVAPDGGPWPDPAANAARVVSGLRPEWYQPHGDASRGLDTATTSPLDRRGVLVDRLETPFGPGVLSDSGDESRRSSSRAARVSRQREPSSAFARRWLAAGAAAARVLAAATSDQQVASAGGLAAASTGPLAVARAVLDAHGPRDWLLVGASNPIRDLDLVQGLDAAGTSVEPDHGPILANRGLAGIDGTVSTAVGMALAAQRSGRDGVCRVLLGDLTFLHDVGGLLVPKLERRVQLQVVVVADGGGSIFETLEHRQYADREPQHRQFERVFAVPSAVDFAAIAHAYQAKHRTISDLAQLRRALHHPSDGIEILTVPTARQQRRELACQLRAQIVSEVNRML